MKYLQLLKKYLFVFVGALLFGLAAVKVKSAQRGENKANNAVQDMVSGQINATDANIRESVRAMESKQAATKKAKENAIKKLDKIGEHSSSVKSLLDDYNHDRVSK